jgi:hypothetical protein
VVHCTSLDTVRQIGTAAKRKKQQQPQQQQQQQQQQSPTNSYTI